MKIKPKMREMKDLVLFVEMITVIEAVSIDIVRVGLMVTLRNSAQFTLLDDIEGQAILLVHVRIVVPDILD